MNFKSLNRNFGFVVLIVTLVVYWLTAQKSVPFWDCSEFSASAIWQQVPHPPGAPLFLMVGKIFDLLFFWGDPGWRINLVSVFATAFTSFFLYHVIVKAIGFIRLKPIEDLSTAISIYSSALIGALAYTFSDTVWFNGVESEVYAFATLFVAIIVYLMLKWLEESDNPGHERYLMLMAYLIGLSTGVQLLALLPVLAIVFMVAFKKYEINTKNFILTGIISVVIFFIIYPFIVKWVPALLAGHSPSRNDAREYAIENNAALKYFAIALIIGAFAAFYYFRSIKKEIPSIIFGCICLIFMGYTTYTHILIRSNSNPPMNENEPKTFTKLSSYLGREQYGDDPMWPRRVKTEEMFTRKYNEKDENGDYIYGEWNPPTQVPITRKDGKTVAMNDWDNVNFMGEINYMIKYQSYHMFLRYLFWNYVGRISDEQDAGFAFIGENEKTIKKFNLEHGYTSIFPIRFFAIPLIFGILGLFYHWQKDKKNAFVFTVMFLMMGVIAALAQKQQDPQPRERDYFYTGAFFIWSAWIGLGTYGLIELVLEKVKSMGASIGVATASLILVPLNMAIGGWAMHDRTGNFMPFDYSYNILQSTEENAILFTNGDNDTFPLWYLQDVMGVRRDVRIVNLSLGNTLWYVHQLKNRTPWGAQKVPLNFSEESLTADEEDQGTALSHSWAPKDRPFFLDVPISKAVISKFTNVDSIVNSNYRFKTQFITDLYDSDSYLMKISDKVIKEIIENTKFERPIYFANTMGADAFAGLDRFLRLEGMAWRLCPIEQMPMKGQEKAFNVDITKKCLYNVDNSENFSTTPKYGFKMRNMNDPSVYYDPVHRRLTNTYRSLYLGLAQAEFEKSKNKDEVKKILQKCDDLISVKLFPLSFDMAFKFASIAEMIGDRKLAESYAKAGLKSSEDLLKYNPKDIYAQAELQGQVYGPRKYSAEFHRITKNYAQAEFVYNDLLKLQQSMIGSSDEQLRPYLEKSISEITFKLAEIQIYKVKDKDGIIAAIKEIDKLVIEKMNARDRFSLSLIRYFIDLKEQFSIEAGLPFNKENAFKELEAGLIANR
jgi:hypothetical protein